MRRMITGKQQEFVEELGEKIFLENGEVAITNNDGASQIILHEANINFLAETLSLQDEDSGVTYFQCEDDLFKLPDLPTSDPHVAGALWNDNGTLKISAGGN